MDISKKFIGFTLVSGIVIAVSALLWRYDEIFGAEPKSPEELAGCYELTLSPWEPAMKIGGDSVYVTPPRQIFLAAEYLKDPITSPDRKLTPVLNTGSPYNFAYWEYKDQGEVVLRWTTGLSGVNVLLAQKGEALDGTAYTHWDFERPVQSAHAMAAKTTCAIAPNNSLQGTARSGRP